jgi:hypothetical protein
MFMQELLTGNEGMSCRLLKSVAVRAGIIEPICRFLLLQLEGRVWHNMPITPLTAGLKSLDEP